MEEARLVGTARVDEVDAESKNPNSVPYFKISHTNEVTDRLHYLMHEYYYLLDP